LGPGTLVESVQVELLDEQPCQLKLVGLFVQLAEIRID